MQKEGRVKISPRTGSWIYSLRSRALMYASMPAHRVNVFPLGGLHKWVKNLERVLDVSRGSAGMEP